MAFTLLDAKKLCAGAAEVGLTLDDPRLVTRINEAQRRLIQWYNLLVRREEYSLNPKIWEELTADDDELILQNLDATKLQVLALWREENNELQMAAAVQQSARSIVQEDLVAEVEGQLKTDRIAYSLGTAFTRVWYIGKIGLDVPTAFASSHLKLERLVIRAGAWIYQRIYEYELIERNRIKDGVPTLGVVPALDNTAFSPPLDYEVMRMVAQAFLSEGDMQASPQGQNTGSGLVSTLMLAEASQLITRRLDAELEALRHSTYTAALAATTANTLGRIVAQAGLELPGGLKLSKAELIRLVNTAEQRLLECGKWKGAIKDAEISVTNAGEVLMPDEFETVLAATINRRPALIKGRWYEFIPGGPGLQTTDCAWVRNTLIDRGIDAGTGKRSYYVVGCPESATLHIRAKRRFVYKSADSDVMQIQNYSALKNAMLCIWAEGFIMPEQRDPKLAAFQWTLAVKILTDEMDEFLGDSASRDVPVQMEAWAMSDIYAPL